MRKRKDHYLGINEALFHYEGKRAAVMLKGYHLDGKEHAIYLGSPSDLLHFLKRRRSELTSLNHYYDNQHLVFYIGSYHGYDPTIPKTYVETGIYFAEHGEKTLFFRRLNGVKKQGVVIGSSDELLMIWNELGRWCEVIIGKEPTYCETTLV